MLIRIAVPEDNVNEAVLNPALEAVTSLNEQLIRQGVSPTFHQALRAGTRWQPEPKDGFESFDNGTLVSQRNWGDCDDLAPLRAGSLRATGEDRDAAAIVYRSGPKRWHAVVQRGDGRIEDPSEMAGMRPSQAYVGAAAPLIARMPRAGVVSCVVGDVLGWDAYGEYDDSGLWMPGGDYPSDDYGGDPYGADASDYYGGYDGGGGGDGGGGYDGGDGGSPPPPTGQMAPPTPPTGGGRAPAPGSPQAMSNRQKPLGPTGGGRPAPGASSPYHGPLPTVPGLPTGRNVPPPRPASNAPHASYGYKGTPGQYAQHVLGTQPVVALRPLYSTRSGAVVGWEARTDMPWSETDYDLSTLRRAGVASQALVGSVLGACMLGQASGTADPRNVQRCMAIVGLLRGAHPHDLADKVGPRAVVGASRFLRDVAGTVAQHGGQGVGIDFGDVFHAIEPVLSKAVSFVPGVGPIISTGLDVTQAATQKHGGGAAPAGGPVCWCVDPKTGSVFAKA